MYKEIKTQDNRMEENHFPIMQKRRENLCLNLI